MLKKFAMFSLITAIILYGAAIIIPFFVPPHWSLTLIKGSMFFLIIGLGSGFLYVLKERRQEKEKEDWDKMKDY